MAQLKATEHEIQQNCVSDEHTPDNVRKIIVPIGTEDGGTIFQVDIGTIPHILVCGYTGTGKTSFVQSIISYIIANYHDSDIKFVVYDSKGIDYAGLHAFPHLLLPIITDTHKAQRSIEWLSSEIDRRLGLYAKTECKDITSYNHHDSNQQDFLPHIYVILDDYSELNLNHSTLIHILKNGRPVGVHLILITSLTSSKVLSRDILSGIPCRIAFCVSSKADSRFVIDQNGAEELSTPGELLFRYDNKCIRCYGIHTPFEDIQAKIDQISPPNTLQTIEETARAVYDAATFETSVQFNVNKLSDQKGSGRH